jgi:hypothetical protein
MAFKQSINGIMKKNGPRLSDKFGLSNLELTTKKIFYLEIFEKFHLSLFLQNLFQIYLLEIVSM